MEKEFRRGKQIYRTYSIDFLELYHNNSKLDNINHVLVVDQFYCDNNLFTDYNINESGETHLFSQIEKELEDEPVFLRDILITISFESVFEDENNKKLFDELQDKFTNGIEFFINGKYVRFSDFLKSNSMSKNFQVFYINNNYRDRIFKRISFGMLDYYNPDCKQKTTLSKWYAYSGLSLTDCTVVLYDLGLTLENIVIIDDLEIPSAKTDSIVALSARYLYDKIKTLNSIFDNSEIKESIDRKYEDVYKEKKLSHSDAYETLFSIVRELKCYLTSPDYDKLIEKYDIDQIKKRRNYKELVRLIEAKEKIHELLELISDLIKNKDITLFDISNICNNAITKFESYVNACDGKEIVWVNLKVNRFRSTVNMFDGEGLITKELADKINNAINNGINYSSFQIRMPFIKGDVHSCDFHEFFKEHGNKTYIVGKTFAGDKVERYDISKVQMILTKSQFKGSKFIGNIPGIDKADSPIKFFFDLMFNKYGYGLGIANLEPKVKKRIKLNYQVISTMPLSHDTIDYLYDLTKEEMDKEIDDIVNNLDKDKELDVYNADKNFFIKTEHYNKLRYEIRDSYLKDAKINRLYAEGCRRILCGDLLHLLYHAAGIESKFAENKLALYANKIYLPNYTFSGDSKECVLLRNPHYSRNEIGYASNFNGCEERDKYFGHITGAVFVNSRFLMHARLGGADFDGDTVIVVTEKKIVDEVKNLFDEKGNNRYPLIQIPSLDATTSGVSYNDRMNTFRSTFSSRVGLISNTAFYDAVKVYSNENATQSDLDRIAMYTILSGLEIDSAKNGKKPAIKAIEFEDSKDYSPEKSFTEYKTALTKTNNVNKKYLDKLEKNIIKENSQEMNNVFYLSSNILKENSNKLSISQIRRSDYSYKKVNEPSKEDIEKTIVGLIAYKELNAALSASNYKSSDLEAVALLKYFGKVLSNKKISSDEGKNILDAFVTDHEKTTENIQKYFNEEYHYIKDSSMKDKLLDELQVDKAIDDRTREIIKDFNDEGYTLLFLALMNSFRKINSFTTRRLLKKEKVDLHIEDYNVGSDTIETSSIEEKLVVLEKNIIKRVNDVADFKVVLTKCKDEFVHFTNKQSFIDCINANFDSKKVDDYVSELDNAFKFDEIFALPVKKMPNKIQNDINKYMFTRKSEIINKELNNYFENTDFEVIYYVLGKNVLINNIVFDVLHDKLVSFLSKGE